MTPPSLLRCLPLCLLLTACASPPPQTPPRTDVPAQWQAGPQPARERLDAWWQGFADPQLAPLIERARRNNPDLGAALARVEQARAQAQVAAGNRWPTLQAGFNGNHERLLRGPGYSGIDTYRDDRRLEVFSLGLAASYEVDFWGGVAARARSGVATWQASAFDRDTLELTLLASVAASYLDFSAVQARAAIAQHNLDNAEQVLALVSTRQAAGAASPLELAQQRGLVARQRQQLDSLRQDAANARLALATLLGEPVARLHLATNDFAHLQVPDTGVGLPSELLARRPDIARAEARLAAAQADVQVARSLMLPRLTLKANLAVGANHLADLFANRYYDLGGALLAPIFNAGALRAGYQASQARQQELLANYRKAILDAFADVDRALNDGAGLDRQLHWQTQVLDQAQQAFGLAETRYRAGADTLLTLLDTQRNLYQAQDDAITLRLQRLKASVALFKALGGGWEGAAESMPQIR